jgi:Flp pilus assembly protein TadG
VTVKIFTFLRALRSDSGQTIAEFAVLLPVFVFVSFVLIDIEWMTRTAAAVEYVVTETARCEAIQSPACAAPSNPQAYAIGLASNLRLDTGLSMNLQTPACGPATCQVSIAYHYKALGAWFPALAIQRTGSAAVPPAPPPP